jgi:Putative transposase
VRITTRILSLPHRLRYLLLWDHGLCRAVLAIYARALLGFERRRARRRGISDGCTGAVAAIHRFGSALDANVHFHTLVLDGVFTAAGNDAVRFDSAPPPSDREDARLLVTIRRRVVRLLRRYSIALDSDREEGGADPTAALRFDTRDSCPVTYRRVRAPAIRTRSDPGCSAGEPLSAFT